MDARVGVDMERYRGALEATGGVIGGVEPISRFHEAFQGPVDAAYAAAVVGLETEPFLEKVRENTGLQNVGLLALEGENGSVKRDTWTSSFRDLIYALDYPQQVGEPPVVTQPDVIPGAHVHIPDPNLRTAIAEELGKSPNAPITVEDMEGLGRLEASDRGIHNLTGIQFATNLNRLELADNQISDFSSIAGLVNLRYLILSHNIVSDLSPVAGLIDLRELNIRGNNFSDLSPLARLINLEYLNLTDANVFDLSPVTGLINLRRLHVTGNNVSNVSPVAGLINLEEFIFHNNNISDLSPLARLTKLEYLSFNSNGVSDIAPFAGLINLKRIRTWGNRFSDLSPLARLTKLERIDICGAELSDLAPLAGLTSLTELYLRSNGIPDISPIAGLTGLTRLNLENNEISDISPLAGLTNLKWLQIAHNEISDFSPLDGLRESVNLVWYENPGFPKGGSKIEGPWLWVALPDTRLEIGTDLLSEVTGGRMTEVNIATQGATVGKPVGDKVWEAHKLVPTGENNIRKMLNLPDFHGVIYGVVSLYSPREQDTTMYVANDEGLKVWLNGDSVFEQLGDRGAGLDYEYFFPVTLQQGKNVLLVAVFSRDADTGAFFGFEPDTDYSVASGVDYAFSQMPIHIGDTFTFNVRAENVVDLAGWQFDIAFDPFVLEALDVSEGIFLKSDAGTTFFQSGSIDNENGKITGLSAARLANSGVSGTGTLLQVRFKALFGGETDFALQRFQFGSIAGEDIPAGPHEIRFTVEGELPTGDVNRDGVVSILDLILIAQQLGKSVPPDSSVDINGDGVVNIFDLTLVAQGIGKSTAAAPAVATGRVDAATIEAWITLARLEDDGSIAFRQGIANLENLLASLIIPQETALHPNYPNPFNPETWIPYQLATPAEVMLTIYDMTGSTVRHLEVGHQPVGLYQSRSRALYWDGRNGRGESVASGLYFYTLRAGEFTATRKMLIRK